MKILSCGAGQQSTALALMSCENAMSEKIIYPLVPVYDAVLVIRSLSVNLTGRIQKKKFQETVAHRILNIRQLWKKYQNDKVFIKIHIKSDCLQG